MFHQSLRGIPIILCSVGDSSIFRGLIAKDPFANSTLKPTFIRAQHYRYQYTGLLAETNAYWLVLVIISYYTL